MANYTSPYKYGKDKNLAPQIIYYLIRQREAPHKVVDGKLMVDIEKFDPWFDEYIINRMMRKGRTKHEHTPACFDGTIAENPNGAAPTTKGEFAFVEGRARQKSAARRSGRKQRTGADFDALLDDISKVKD